MCTLSRSLFTATLAVSLGTVDAGIAGFHKWFQSNFREAVTLTDPWQEETFDHVALDMNQILHVAVRKATSEGAAIQRIFQQVNTILRQCQPSKSVVFAFDGSAPVAKMVVQRKRREDGSKIDPRDGLSTLQISPGTEFMERLASAMEYFAYRKCQQDKYSGVKFYISGSNTPGEGELKCIDWVKRSCKAGTEESVVLVGGDADLVLQGLALSQVKNLFVYYQDERRGGRVSSLWEVVRSLDELFPGQSEYMRVDLLLLMALNGNDYLPKVRGISFAATFSAYLEVKQRGKQRDNFFLVDGATRSFTWDFLVDFFATIAERYTVIDASAQQSLEKHPSAAMLLNLAGNAGMLGRRENVVITVDLVDVNSLDACTVDKSSRPQYRSSATVEGRTFSWLHAPGVSKREAKQAAAAMLLKELIPDLYQKFLRIEADRQREEALHSKPAKDEGTEAHDTWLRERAERERSLYSVEKYLTGLLWNLQMYVDGYSPDFYWQYGLRYAPSCAEIVAWVKENPEALPRIVPPVSRAPPMPSGLACLCLMPLTAMGREYLPARLKPLVDPGKPVWDVLKWIGPRSGVNVANLFKAVQSEAPEELEEFFASSHSSEAWKVIYHDSDEDAPSRDDTSPRQPPPPTVAYPALPYNGNVRMKTMAATASSPCDPWCNSSDPESRQQPQVVGAEPFKKAFERDAKGTLDRTARHRVRTHSGGRGQREESGQARSAAWRETTSASGIRRAVRGSGTGRAVDASRRNGDGPEYPQSRPAAAKAKARVPPAVAPPGTGPSMSFSQATFGGRPRSRLRL